MSLIYKHGRNDVSIPLHFASSVEKIHQFISDVEGIPCNDFYLTYNGRCLPHEDNCLSLPCTIRSHFRLRGGKGGFGSMLRAIGARIEKTTNHEACRDLSGRRMRDVNHEKAIGEWVKKKEVDDAERKEKRIKKLERMINPQHHYEDAGYTSNLQLNAEKIDGAIKEALQKRDEKNGSKRKLTKKESDGAGKKKKGRMWIGYSDDESDSDLDGDNIVSIEGENAPCSSKKSDNTNITADMKNLGTEEDADIACSSGSSSGKNKILKSIKEGDVAGRSEIADSSFCKYEACGENLDDDHHTDTSAKADNNIPCSNTDTAADCSSSLTQDQDEKTEEENSASKSPVDDTKTITTTNEGESATSGKGDAATVVDKDEPLNLEDYGSSEHLESVGLERLKSALTSMGLKCGGTLRERAQRLYLTKHTPLEKLDKSLFAKPSKGKKKK